ncbi:MAG: helicase-associated domain-containing protein [Actinomyces sp.]|uniref:helicase-associated domain-containing protein n=1 Tax=Actinomyces sp. TaxID=29317 RepID=UPI0026DC4BD7|nr:helicase-associated domain-containing protein [Actinomyces sp.]MDO4244000.1 helicase-associated domain-containing protein [Actinomyces sp.]
MSQKDPVSDGGGEPVADVAQLAAHLAALPDEALVALLAARPDLATPPSGSLTALAARAASRPSVEAALAELDAVDLAVAEAVLALGIRQAPGLAAALGVDQDAAARSLVRLEELALLIGAGPVHGLVEALGPYPLGLGPSADPPPPTLPEPLPASPAEPGNAPAPATASSPEAQAMLAALAWGPPVGTVRTGGRSAGVDELLARGWLVPAGPGTGPAAGPRTVPGAVAAAGTRPSRPTTERTRLVMPREVALALRGGRLTREPLTPPDPSSLGRVDAASLASESTRGAEEIVRLAAALLTEWGREGAPLLRAGGVGVRALTRTAEALDLEPGTAATLIEMVAAAGLLGLDEDGTTWVPSTEAAAWTGTGTPERWARLAAAWPASARAPWLVGSRSENGTLRPVLGDEVEAAWARDLRRRILLLLADLPQGRAATPTWVRAALTAARPRRPVPTGAVSAVLEEAAMLGLTGAGALSRAGWVLAEAVSGAGRHDTTRGPVPGQEEADAVGLLMSLEAALAADLPAPVDTLLIQSDLTAIVPGRPSAGLAALLERSTVVESRGGALTVRFTPDSVRAALDTGIGATELAHALERFSPTALPDALVVLIDDAARRHGSVRVREVSTVLRIPDPAVAATLVGDPRLSDLGLAELAPGVVVSTAPAGRVLRELRGAGLAPVLEDAEGRRLLSPDDGAGHRPAPPPARPGNEHSVRRSRPGPRELAGLVVRMRAGQQEEGDPAAATDPVHVLALLRQAQSSRARVRLRIVGSDGAVQDRSVRVLAVEPGRVRLADVVRQTELTVAVHRIVSVEQT